MHIHTYICRYIHTYTYMHALVDIRVGREPTAAMSSSRPACCERDFARHHNPKTASQLQA